MVDDHALELSTELQLGMLDHLVKHGGRQVHDLLVGDVRSLFIQWSNIPCTGPSAPSWRRPIRPRSWRAPRKRGKHPQIFLMHGLQGVLGLHPGFANGPHVDDEELPRQDDLALLRELDVGFGQLPGELLVEGLGGALGEIPKYLPNSSLDVPGLDGEFEYGLDVSGIKSQSPNRRPVIRS